MGDGEWKKHKDFIEPGSKENAEATEALNEVLDEASRRTRSGVVGRRRRSDGA